MPDPITMGEYKRAKAVRERIRGVNRELDEIIGIGDGQGMTVHRVYGHVSDRFGWSIGESAQEIADRLRARCEVRSIWTEERIERWRREVRGEAFWRGM